MIETVYSGLAGIFENSCPSLLLSTIGTIDTELNKMAKLFTYKEDLTVIQT